MSYPLSPITLTAKEYRTKYGAEMPTLKLARIMYAENPILFTNLEHARYTLRRIEGKAGSYKLNHMKDKSFVVEEERPKNPYKLPESDEEAIEHYYIEGHKKGLIMSDIHLPYHSISALSAVIEFGIKYEPDFIFINGDLTDFHSLSYFMKDPRKKRFNEELEIAKDFLENLKKIFKCKIYFKFGNHEFRYESFLFQKAHELKGIEEFELKNLFKSRVPDLEIIEDKQLVIMNGLPFIHGHEFGRGLFNPVNAARGLFLQAKHSAVKGDCHATSKHVEKDILGKIMTTHSIGCLCGLTPKWLPLNKWNHGFATIDLIGDNEYNFRNYEIYNGKIL